MISYVLLARQINTRNWVQSRQINKLLRNEMIWTRPFRCLELDEKDPNIKGREPPRTICPEILTCLVHRSIYTAWSESGLACVEPWFWEVPDPQNPGVLPRSPMSLEHVAIELHNTLGDKAVATESHCDRKSLWTLIGFSKDCAFL
jgi:hypothetical protein